MPAKPVTEPRDIYVIQAMLGLAKEIYFSQGGYDIDVHIDGMTLQADAFKSQMEAARMMRSDVGPGAWGPTISAHASSVAAGHGTRLLRLRENKMAQCISWAEEHIATELAKENKQKEEKEKQNAPDSPVRQDRESGVDTSELEPVKASSQSPRQSASDDGDRFGKLPGVQTVVPEHLQRGRA